MSGQQFYYIVDFIHCRLGHGRISVVNNSRQLIGMQGNPVRFLSVGYCVKDRNVTALEHITGNNVLHPTIEVAVEQKAQDLNLNGYIF